MVDVHDLEVKYDSAAMRRMAEDLEELAGRLDAADESIPKQVDAGVFAPHVADQVNESVANVAALILRLQSAASLLRATADAKDETERDNEQQASGIDDDYMGVNPR